MARIIATTKGRRIRTGTKSKSSVSILPPHSTINMKKARVKDFVKNPQNRLSYLILEVSKTLFNVNCLFLWRHRCILLFLLSTIGASRRRDARIITLNSRHLDSLVES
jgi:hypothetical protein